MIEIGITTLLIIVANIFCTVQGLHDHPSFVRYNFQVDKTLLQKDYKRLFTSGFFHISWLHLFVNMVTLCLFSGGLELQLGGANYLLVFLASLLGGNLFALLVHRHHGEYNAAGATGAITGTIFATIALFPGFEIGFMGMQFPVPGWFYGFLYVLFSLYGIKSKRDNTGHDANLAGGLAGLLVGILMRPAVLTSNYLAILAVFIPTLFFISILLTKPGFLLVSARSIVPERKNHKAERILRAELLNHQQEIDLILEKIHENGIESLTPVEKEKLDYFSKIIR